MSLTETFLSLSDDSSLLMRDEVPVTFHEVGILKGYRKPWSSLSECLRSAFQPSNETLNFWTHFLPFWYFVWTLRDFFADKNFVQDAYHWPFLAYMCTVCAWPMVSCLAHLFSIMSENSRHICFFIDYLSLSWYSFGVAVVYHSYCFDSVFFHTWYSRSYLWVCAAAAIFCTFTACSTRFIARQKPRKALRVFAFVIPYAVVNFPLLERIVHCEMSGCKDAAIWQHERQFFWATVGIALYSLHFPEKMAPGLFDIVGHSHQIFHICGVLATFDQLWACHTDMRVRRSFMRATDSLPRGFNDTCMVAGVLGVGVVIVSVFIYRLFHGLQYACPSVENLTDEDAYTRWRRKSLSRESSVEPSDDDFTVLEKTKIA